METAFDDIQGKIDYVDFYGDYMILGREEGNYTMTSSIIWWDKSNIAEVQKRLIIKNARLLGMGVIENTLIVVKSIGIATTSTLG